MGSNMAEAHPVGFRWPMKAREKGATIIHVDPRFTRTSAAANLYVPIRPGTDIAFLGGLINYILAHDKWFKEYVLAYTNASSIVDEGYVDAEDGDGMFSGFDPANNRYDNSSWTYSGPPTQQKEDAASHSGHGQEGTSPAKHAPYRDETLQNPRCVLQILKRHFARYTPEMVEDVCWNAKTSSAAGRGDADAELRTRAHGCHLLCGRLDAAEFRAADHPRGGHPAIAAGQYGATRRRHHGAAWPRLDPGIDRCSHPLRPAAGLPAAAGQLPRR